MIKLVGSLTIGGKTFSEKDSIGAVGRDFIGLSDDWYGGFVKSFLRTKEGFFICRDKRDNLVNLAYDEDTLTDEGKKLLEAEYDTTKVPVDKPVEEMARKELLALAKTLDIAGKIATLSTDELREKVKEVMDEK